MNDRIFSIEGESTSSSLLLVPLDTECFLISVPSLVVFSLNIAFAILSFSSISCCLSVCFFALAPEFASPLLAVLLVDFAPAVVPFAALLVVDFAAVVPAAAAAFQVYWISNIYDTATFPPRAP